ncbi:MAG: glucuronate isomerase, partial [Bacteroidota bacterium]
MKNPTFLDEDFLLHSEEARLLYHDHAVKMPIVDYHNHLSPKDITENRQFTNLTEIW